MSVIRFEGRVNPITQAPDMVMMNNLVGAAAEVVTDASLRPGTAQLELQPPEAFEATLTSSGHLRVASVEGVAQESSATLRLGPQDPTQDGPYISVRTTSRDAIAHGTEENPLRARGIGLITNGEGRAQVEHARVSGNVRLHPEFIRKVSVGLGVFAGRIIHRR